MPESIPYEFDRDTTVTPGAPGVFDVDLSAGWSITHALNGGYVLAVVGRALAESLPHPHPFTVTAHYLTATLAGPAQIRTDVARTGNTSSTASASLFQTTEEGEEVERIRVLATYGDLDALSDEVATTATPPELPAPGECFSPADNPGGGNPEMSHRLRMHLDPHTCGWAVGEPTGRGEIRSWLGLADGRDHDPLSLLMAVDALPPTAFDYGVQGWVPTVELTVHVRAMPAPGLLRIALRSRNLAGGYLEEDAEVWDCKDRLVAQSRQLARVRRK